MARASSRPGRRSAPCVGLAPRSSARRRGCHRSARGSGTPPCSRGCNAAPAGRSTASCCAVARFSAAPRTAYPPGRASPNPPPGADAARPSPDSAASSPAIWARGRSARPSRPDRPTDPAPRKSRCRRPPSRANGQFGRRETSTRPILRGDQLDQPAATARALRIVEQMAVIAQRRGGPRMFQDDLHLPDCRAAVDQLGGVEVPEGVLGIGGPAVRLRQPGPVAQPGPGRCWRSSTAARGALGRSGTPGRAPIAGSRADIPATVASRPAGYRAYDVRPGSWDRRSRRIR